MPFYCNCLDSWEKIHQKKFNAQFKWLGSYKYQEVKTDKEDLCIYCGHTAFFSKLLPEQLNNSRELFRSLEMEKKCSASMLD